MGFFKILHCIRYGNKTDGVTSIGHDAFYNCTGLTSVTIGDGVTSIGSNAFYNCTSLTDVYYTGSEEKWNNIEIGNGNNILTSATIHYLTDECFTVSGGTVTNTSQISQAATVIIADYDTNGALIDVLSQELTFNAGSGITFTVPENGRLFVWDSLGGMKPLAE